MQPILIEPFDYLASTADGTEGSLSSLYPRPIDIPFTFKGTDITLITGLQGYGKAIRFKQNITAPNGIDMQTYQNVSQFTLCFAVRPINVFTSQLFLEVRDEFNNFQWGLKWNNAHKFELRGENGAFIAQSDEVALNNQIYRFCIQCDFLTGSLTTTINGYEDTGLTFTGLDIQDSPASNKIGFLRLMPTDATNGQSAYTHDIDDIYITDELRDYGPMEVYTTVPESDILKEWTRSAGTENFDNVNDIPVDLNGTYNYAEVVGKRDLFEFTNIPRVPNEIFSASLRVMGKKDDSAERQIRQQTRVGGVDFNGPDHIMLNAYAIHTAHWDKNPGTDLPWTPADIDAFQGGYEYRV